MHDIRMIRDDPAAFDAALARRGIMSLSSDGTPPSRQVLDIDRTWRAETTRAERLQSDIRTHSSMIGKAMKAGDAVEAERLKAVVQGIKSELAGIEARQAELRAGLDTLLLGIPNLPLDDVPDGADESANVELRRWGTPRSFDFAPREHWELGEAMGAMDFETAARLSGSRFVVLKGALIRLHRALAQFMLDTHVDRNGLTEMWTPVLVRDEAMLGTGQLPKFAEDSFVGDWFSGRAERLNRALSEHRTADDLAAVAAGRPLEDVVQDILERAPTREGFWLIPTAEVTLTNTVAGEIVEEDTLPRRLTAWTQCFRSEAGSAGKDTRGMLRQHQFEKVEMVSITRPEDSLEELERMTRCAEGILEALDLPYRRVVLSTGDMGFGAQRTHDIEVWLPGQDAYREISSCSVCGDFQARRMNARFRRAGEKRPEFVHTLNGSGLAIGRTLIAVMENGQDADGGIAIPEVLRPWLRGAARIAPDGSLA